MIKITDKKQTSKHVKQSPSFLKLAQGESKRVVFLTDEMAHSLVYDLRDLTMPKDLNNFKFSAKSITAQSVGDIEEIKKLLSNGDPEGKLKIDAKTIGEPPKLLAAVPVFVYPTDQEGNVNKELLGARGYTVEMLMVTTSRFEQIVAAANKLANKGISFTEVDFTISVPKNKKGWVVEAEVLDDCLYKKYKEKISPHVQGLLNKEFERLGVSSLEEFGNQYLGIALTESKWFSLLSKYGYDVVGAPTNAQDDDDEPAFDANGDSDEESAQTPQDNLFPPDEEDVKFE